MGRRKNADPSIEWHVYIPTTLAAEVELLLLDPFLQQAKFGAKSTLVTNLLRQWVEEQKTAVAQAQPEQTKP